jgi:hypothetical protein
LFGKAVKKFGKEKLEVFGGGMNNAENTGGLFGDLMKVDEKATENS